MADTHPVRFRPIEGGYEVRHQESAVLMGTVRKRGSGWVATKLDHRTIKDGGGQVAATFPTRVRAAEALARRF